MVNHDSYYLSPAAVEQRVRALGPRLARELRLALDTGTVPRWWGTPALEALAVAYGSDCPTTEAMIESAVRGAVV